MSDLRLREICTMIAFGGKSLEEIGFPDEWEYDWVLRIYERDGFDGECDGIKTREKYVLSEKQLCEMGVKRGRKATV